MKVTIIALAICLFLAFAFGWSNAQTASVDDLCQHWVQSDEKQQKEGREQIFRPVESREFSPSRFRMQYKFDKNGDCKWLYLSPDDNHRFRDGKWKLDAKDKTLLTITTDGTTKSFRIEELSKSILRFQYFPTDLVNTGSFL